MTGFELDFIVPDSMAALALYETIFPIERLEVTDFPPGQNEAVFRLYGMRVHMLDENAAYGMVAPKPGDPKPIWFNIVVDDIVAIYARALANGCAEVMPVTAMEDMGVRMAQFSDPYGYLWMLHQVDRVVPFEERIQVMTEAMKKEEDT